MSNTRSKDKQLEEFTDNPEGIACKKRTKMADTNGDAATVVLVNNKGYAGDKENDYNLNESRDNIIPTQEFYLPDTENTPLLEAKKRAIQWGRNEDEHLVKCPAIGKHYGETTLLVNFRSGLCQLFTPGELPTITVR